MTRLESAVVPAVLFGEKISLVLQMGKVPADTVTVLDESREDIAVNNREVNHAILPLDNKHLNNIPHGLESVYTEKCIGYFHFANQSFECPTFSFPTRHEARIDVVNYNPEITIYGTNRFII